MATNREKFKEVFGYDLYESYNNCELFDCDDTCSKNGHSCGKCELKDFWNKEYKEPQNLMPLL